MAKPIQDTIEFTLSAEETVVNDTVRITASIVGMIAQDTSEQSLRESIRTMMKKFIDTDWQFSNVARTSHASGQEQITLNATTRVAESENYALDRRREEASREVNGLRIVSASVDTSATTTQIQETQQKLRLALLKTAQEEARLINQTLTETLYRLGAVTFGQVYDSESNTRAGGRMAMASAASAAYGSGFSNDDTIGNAVKLTMQATVQLRISR
jgi:hypothetical protein